jgi:hypothetical protein
VSHCGKRSSSASRTSRRLGSRSFSSLPS